MSAIALHAVSAMFLWKGQSFTYHDEVYGTRWRMWKVRALQEKPSGPYLFIIMYVKL
jgi:hypothetical protein